MEIVVSGGVFNQFWAVRMKIGYNAFVDDSLETGNELIGLLGFNAEHVDFHVVEVFFRLLHFFRAFMYLDSSAYACNHYK